MKKSALLFALLTLSCLLGCTPSNHIVTKPGTTSIQKSVEETPPSDSWQYERTIRITPSPTPPKPQSLYLSPAARALVIASLGTYEPPSIPPVPSVTKSPGETVEIKEKFSGSKTGPGQSTISSGQATGAGGEAHGPNATVQQDGKAGEFSLDKVGDGKSAEQTFFGKVSMPAGFSLSRFFWVLCVLCGLLSAVFVALKWFRQAALAGALCFLCALCAIEPLALLLLILALVGAVMYYAHHQTQASALATQQSDALASLWRGARLIGKEEDLHKASAQVADKGADVLHSSRINELGV